jgi:hypothetical protein
MRRSQLLDGRFIVDRTIKRWAVSGLKDTKPLTMEINWREEKRA